MIWKCALTCVIISEPFCSSAISPHILHGRVGLESDLCPIPTDLWHVSDFLSDDSDLCIYGLWTRGRCCVGKVLVVECQNKSKHFEHLHMHIPPHNPGQFSQHCKQYQYVFMNEINQGTRGLSVFELHLLLYHQFCRVLVDRPGKALFQHWHFHKQLCKYTINTHLRDYTVQLTTHKTCSNKALQQISWGFVQSHPLFFFFLTRWEWGTYSSPHSRSPHFEKGEEQQAYPSPRYVLSLGMTSSVTQQSMPQRKQLLCAWVNR